MTEQPSLAVDQKKVIRNFSLAAKSYDDFAVLQREVASRMLERLDYVRLAPDRVLDLGTGTGGVTNALAERYPRALVTGVDICLPMLSIARRKHSRLKRLLPFVRSGKSALYINADACALPLASHSTQLIWSNQMLQWVSDPLQTFREAFRVLDVGGLFTFSTLGPDSFKELRAAFCDAGGRTQFFADMHDLGDMLVEAGFSDPVMDVDTITMTYANFADLVRDLKANGSTCAMQNRAKGLQGKKSWGEAARRYEQFAHDERLPATFEIVYGHAWKSAPKTVPDGRSIIQFDPKQRLRK